jgi:hypothetical protein
MLNKSYPYENYYLKESTFAEGNEHKYAAM